MNDLDDLISDLSVTKATKEMDSVTGRLEKLSSGSELPSAKAVDGAAHAELNNLVNAGSGSPAAAPKRAVVKGPPAKIDPNAPICSDCKEPILGEQPIQAIGLTFHPEHFNCASCKKNLVGLPFFASDNKPFCDKCINEVVLLPRCAFCNEPIKGKCLSALGKNWHPDHFFCSQCGRHFGPDEGFLEHEGKAYCEEDYNNMFAPKCGTCDKPILDEVVSALGKNFHTKCFVCSEPGCKVELIESGNFFDYGGKPYCENHYHEQRGSLCASCQKPIVGRCLTAIGKKFHPEHFVCAFCKKQLANSNGTPSTFKDKDGKPYCTGCHIKLYG